MDLLRATFFCYKFCMRMEFFFILLGYFILLLFVSFFFSKRMKSLEDFFLASRNLPAFLVYLSLAASWLGGTSTLVSVDEAYRQGVSSFWVMGMPAVLTVLVFAFFLARPIRRLPIVTLPDLVEMRYSRTVRHLASILIVWYMVLLASSQMVAVGKFLESFLGTTYFYSLVLGTAVVFIYSIFGGFFSVVVTDSLQFFLLAAGILSLFIFMTGTSALKEISSLASELGNSNYFNFFYDIKRNLLIVLSFTLAWTISPIAWQRIQAARSEKDARHGLFGTAGTFFVVYWCIVLIGMMSLAVFSSEAQEGPLLSALILSKTGRVLGGILFIAIVAAIMSTMDTAINTGALSLTRDIYQQFFATNRIKDVVTVSRLSTFFVGVLAFLIATKLQSILKTLGLASEIMTEGFFIPGIAMIFLKKKWPTAGFLSLFLGGAYSIIGFLCEIKLLHLNWPAWPYRVPYGIGLCLAGFITGAIIDRYNRGISR